MCAALSVCVVCQCLLETYPHRLTGDVCDRALSRTPLHWAAVNGHLDIVRYLVEEVGG